jgi:hypothetical protein
MRFEGDDEDEMEDERPDNALEVRTEYGQYMDPGISVKSPTSKGMPEYEQYKSEVRDEVHSLKKLGVNNDIRVSR